MLLSNGIDFAAVDEAGNNALHVAVREGNVRTARVLLTESRSELKIVKVPVFRIRIRWIRMFLGLLDPR